MQKPPASSTPPRFPSGSPPGSLPGNPSDLLRALISATSGIVYQMSADWAKMYLLKGEGVLADTVTSNERWVVEYIPDSERPRVWEAISKAISERSIFDLEHQVILKDGGIGWVHSRAAPLFDSESQIASWFGTASDISERKRHEELHRYLLELADALRLAVDTSEIQEIAMRVLGGYLGVARCQYYEVDSNDEWLNSTGGYSDGIPLVTKRVRMDDFGAYIREAFQKGETLAVEDVSKDTRISSSDLRAYEELGFHSYVGVPLLKNGRFVASLGIHQAAPRKWTEQEIACAEETAQRTWAAIERARAEAALREREEKYRHLFNAMDEGYCIIRMIYDDEGRPVDWLFVETNPAFEKHNGLPDAVGKTMKGMVPAIEHKWVEIYNEVAVSGVSRRFVEDSVPLGRTFDLYAFRVGDPSLCEVAVLFTDITARLRAEEKLRLSEHRLRIALESAQLAAWDWMVPENRVTWNDRHYLLLGLEAGSGAVDPGYFLKHVHPEDQLKVQRELEEAVQQAKLFEAEFRIIRTDNEVRWMMGFGQPVESRDGSVTRIAGVMLDITDRRIAAENLKEAHDELETKVAERTAALSEALSSLRQLESTRRELLDRLVTTQEDERLRISRELHDHLSQHMVSVKMELYSFRRTIDSMESRQAGGLTESVGRLSDRIDALIQAAHRQAWELRPPELDDLGLEVALQHYGQVWSDLCDIPVIWSAPGWDSLRLPARTEIAVYRVVQEALANVARHAKANHVQITLKPGPVTVQIEDDGDGFDPQASSGRLGILGMRERISLLGGELEIQSSPGHGAKLTVRLPE